MLMDYCALGTHTRRNCYLLPHIDDLFDQLECANTFSSLDLAQGDH